MVKFKRSGFLISSSFHTSLDKFPAELLYLTFQEFDIPTLLIVCNVCKRFQQICSKVLSRKFKEPKVGINLIFEQEYKWRFNVLFEISEYNEKTGNFIFKPTTKKPMRFISSSMIKSPVLSKISITGLEDDDEIKKRSLPSTTTTTTITTTTTLTTTTVNNETNTPSSSTTSPSSRNSSIKVKKLENNFLQKPLSLDIKSHKETINKVQHVYRIGNGTSHLRIPYRFKYSIIDTPPPSTQITRGGERWLTPISFECPPSFFYPREPTAHKIIMNIIQLRKKNKKKPSSSSPSLPSSQQTSNYRFEVVEDFISVEFLNNNNMRNNRLLFERQLSQQEHLMASSSSSSSSSSSPIRRSRRKFIWGARGG